MDTRATWFSSSYRYQPTGPCSPKRSAALSRLDMERGCGGGTVRIRGTGVRLAALAAGLAGLAPAALAGSGAAATAVASSAATWHVVASTKTAVLSALAAPSRTNVWALGTGIVTGRPEEGFPFGLHWNGRSWTKASFPRAISKTGIGCAGATAANDTWAFAGTSSGGNSAAAAGALRLVNGQWKLVKAFPA